MVEEGKAVYKGRRVSCDVKDLDDCSDDEKDMKCKEPMKKGRYYVQR